MREVGGSSLNSKFGCSILEIRRNIKLISVIIIISLVGYYFLIPKYNIVQLLGAGATFPYPLIFKWTQEFRKIYPNITVNYQAIGSGGGIRAIIEQTVDFGASDVPLNNKEFEEARKKGTILHVPETIGAIAIVYNIPELNGRLKLSGEVLADIYLGKIAKWNDPRIASLNPGLNLPDQDIIVVKRSDGSGTTYIFTDFLSAVSEEWKTLIGPTKIFDFPDNIGDRGIAAKGNQGVSGVIQQNPYTIGYIELAYAIQNNFPVALIRNKDGYFVEPNITTIQAAAAGIVQQLPKPWDSWENVSIVYAPGKLAYPLSSLSYILVYAEQRDYRKCLALKKWLSWIVTEGQKFAEELHYVPLPQEIIQLDLLAIEHIRYLGEISSLNGSIKWYNDVITCFLFSQRLEFVI